MTFADRQDAGRQLAEALADYREQNDTIVLGLPRGGVITASEVAKALKLPLDIVVPRKIGFPGNPELAIGAVTEDGEEILHEEMLKHYDIDEAYLRGEVDKERAEAKRRLKAYRGDKKPLVLQGKTAIVVDDGVATGATMMAALTSCRAKQAAAIIAAVPVIATDTISKLEALSDKVIWLHAPLFFGSVGSFYTDFPQTTDDEVIEQLKRYS